MSFFKDLEDVNSIHLATILMVLLWLLPGFQEKLFIENVLFANLDVLRTAAYAAVVGTTLLIMGGGFWLWFDNTNDPVDPDNVSLLSTSFLAMLTSSLISTILIGVDFLFQLHMTARVYFIVLFGSSVLVPAILATINWMTKKKSSK